jgi:acyl-CoA thioester hydrolase
MNNLFSYSYYHPIVIRYSDIDAQKHVNNAVVITYLESARMGYYQACGLWDGKAFDKFGMVVAAIKIDYLKPILFGQSIRIGLRISRIGNKSLQFIFQVEDQSETITFARGEIIMVAYDPKREKSIPVPTDWKEKIENFEKMGEKNEPSTN